MSENPTEPMVLPPADGGPRLTRGPERLGSVAMGTSSAALPLARRSPTTYKPGHPDYDRAEAAQQETERKTQEAIQEALTGKHLEACGVRLEQAEWLLGQRGALQPNTARQAVAQMLASGKLFVLLLGRVGSGKTLAACEAFLSLKRDVDLRHLDAAHGRSWAWGNPGAFIKARRFAALSQFKEDRVTVEHLHRSPLTVVDEIGAETAPLVGALDDLIDERYAEHRRTILTGNLTVEEFTARYGERIIDRIRQYGIVVECLEKSYRVAPAKPTEEP